MELLQVTIVICAYVVAESLARPDWGGGVRASVRWRELCIYACMHILAILAMTGSILVFRLAVGLGLLHLLINLVSIGLQSSRVMPGSFPGRRIYRLAVFGLTHAAHVGGVLGFLSFVPTEVAGGFASGSYSRHPGLMLHFDVLLAGFLTAVFFGADVVAIVLEQFVPDPERTEEGNQIVIKVRPSPEASRLIGKLERCVVFLLVVTGNFAGVGFLAAAKSVFRFGELKDAKDHQQAEYILIGTLMSFTWSAMVAWMTLHIAGLLSTYQWAALMTAFATVRPV
jgi:hypothetical protein